MTTTTDALDDLLNHYGYTPYINFGHQENTAQLMGHFSAAPIYLNAILRQAEEIAKEGNRTGVQATLMEAHVWLDNLAITFTWKQVSDDLEEYDDWKDNDEDRLEDEEDRPGQHGPRFQSALDSLETAAEQYGSFIRDIRDTDSPELMELWRAITMAQGHIAALEYHFAQCGTDLPQRTLAGHALAMDITTQTLFFAQQRLSSAVNLKTRGPRPSKARIRECLNNIEAAVNRSLESFHRTENLKPVSLHPNLNRDSSLAESAQELGEVLKGKDEEFILDLNLDSPRNSLIAYRSATGVQVKRIVDHYDQWPLKPETPPAHAEAFLYTAEQIVESGETVPKELLALARMVFDHAICTDFDTDHQEVQLFRDALHEINGDPLAVREALLAALNEDHLGYQLYFHASPPPTPAISQEQATAVIQAGRGAGLTGAQLRALAQAMEHRTDALEIEPPQADTDSILAALELCPKILDSSQVMYIMEIMGGHPEDPSVTEWIKVNSADDDLSDDDIDLDDEDC